MEATLAAALFQLTAARRRLGRHSSVLLIREDFNSQPREGGWAGNIALFGAAAEFQLTAARRRLANRLLLK